jgi:hypothetical protein
VPDKMQDSGSNDMKAHNECIGTPLRQRKVGATHLVPACANLSKRLHAKQAKSWD